MNASFDRVSWFYDPLARLVFGSAIRQSQVALLSFVPADASVLLVGGGTGWLLPDIVTLQIPLQITYLELSSRMLTRARKTCAGLPANQLQVTFRQGTEADLRADEKFNVIFTPFVLDLYPENLLIPMMQRLYQHLKPNSYWLVADFFIDQTRSRKEQWWQHNLTQAMYTFFGKLCNLQTHTLPHLDNLFQRLPGQLMYTKYFYSGFIRSQVYHFSFKDI
ncbi:class I SAM-dependent methyltransferase [Adhaeribacter arboris]|uniref:Class I SAM-dependent methyltransferase n=1 Tax=Adhaeribacter arboris TaxID=2072846 RepID=A0A2T2YL47_9BACT|nr:class I SAM-dependent methyltransferase [Adhaeribacter arboris]PSR56220.1 class I SAM-dependent methyltransferase [Adhaeribacter arboris]